MMKPTLTTIKKLLVFLITLSTCMSCTKNQLPIEDTKTAYLYLQADPFSLDPRIGGDRRSQILIRELFEGLVRIGKEGAYELALAKSYTVSEDECVYTFTLHPSKWSNGDPVTAHDFVYAWKSLIDPDFITPYSYAFYIIKNAKKAHMREASLDDIGLKAVDDLTLEITLEHPAPYFMELASNPLYSPIHRKSVQENQHWASGTSQTGYISNGPFILKDRSLKSHITLEKNPYYWNTQDSPKIENINFAIIEDLQTAFNMFRGGQLDWLGEPCGNIPLEMVHELNSLGLLEKHSKGGVYWYVVSTQKPHLKSIKIRQAIASAIDRKAITDHLLQAGETPAFSLLPKEMSMLDSPLFEDNSPTTAKALFQEGLQELGLTSETYPTLIISHWSDSRDRMLAETIQEQLQKTLGINVVLQSNDWSSYLKKVTSGDLEIGGFGWYSWFYDPMYNLEYIKFRGSGINGSQWENADYIAALDAADNERDTYRRKEHMKRAETIAMTELPVIPIFYQTYKYAKSSHLHGEVLSRLGLMELKWLEKD